MKKKIKISIFISDVGFGHMVREREIIFELIRQIKNLEITIFNKNNIHLLKNIFKDKVKYYKKFNNIEVINNQNGTLDKKKTIFFNKSWETRIQKDLKKHKNLFNKFDIFISDLVPEIFLFARNANKLSFGICHYTWDWFFLKISKTLKKQSSLIKNYNSLATKIYVPPFTPASIIKDNKNLKQVNFILGKEKTQKLNQNTNILLIDNGTGVLSKLICKTVPFIRNNKDFFFFIGVTFLDKKTKYLIESSNNLILINKSLKTMYSYINKVDCVVARGGYNTITECLLFQKPSMLFQEKNNPEISENIKQILKKNLTYRIDGKNWGSNFLPTLNYFYKKKKYRIYKNLKNNNFQSNGAQQIVSDIKKYLSI